MASGGRLIPKCFCEAKGCFGAFRICSISYGVVEELGEHPLKTEGCAALEWGTGDGHFRNSPSHFAVIKGKFLNVTGRIFISPVPDI